MSNGNQQAPGTGSRSPRSSGGPVPATYSSSGQPTAPAPASPSRYQRIALVDLLADLALDGAPELTRPLREMLERAYSRFSPPSFESMPAPPPQPTLPR